MATTSRKPGKKRIMVQIWGKLARTIDAEFKALHLKRDQYLNRLIGNELVELEREVTFRNPAEVHARLVGRKLGGFKVEARRL